MKKEELTVLRSVVEALKPTIKRIDWVLDSSKEITDSQYNKLREAHDYIANARDIIEQFNFSEI